MEEPMAGDTRSPVDSIVWGDRVLLMGDGEFAPGCGHPRAIDTWVRDSGGAWTHAPFQPAFCAGGVPVAAAAGGLAVIVGAGSGDVPYAMSSGDGLHWVDRPDAFADLGLPFGLATTETGFVATGASATGPWVAGSANGAGWIDSNRLPGPAEARPLGVWVANGRLLVMLAGPDGSLAAASSVNGRTWAHELAGNMISDQILRLRATADGLVALGGDELGLAIWVSGDGSNWRRILQPLAGLSGRFRDVAVGRGRGVIVGAVETGAGLGPAVWVGPAALLVP
jgi:hypothetical protein